MINHIIHASLIISNVAQSLEFYCTVLKLKQDLGRPDLGYPGIWLNVGTQQIHLLQLPNPDPTTQRPQHGGRDRHIALAVHDLDQLTALLIQSHISFTTSKSVRRALFCRDPDGNALEFIEQTIV